LERNCSWSLYALPSATMPNALPRYSVYLQLLRTSLVIGAIYDFALALILGFQPRFLSTLLKVPLPEEIFFLHILAGVVAMLSGFYLLAAWDPISYQGNILVAIAGRALAGGVICAAAGGDGLAGLWLPGVADLLFALAHAVFWWPVRR
jgi:hypothetical protein